ncbi:MAG TPA: hypothetical protein VKB85_16360 [Propionibacteriaceae bacterium]|nr:hypothetical protein [Propionibacteriaceae bacterium]
MSGELYGDHQIVAAGFACLRPRARWSCSLNESLGGVATRVAIATRVEGINLEDEAACGMG